MLLEPEIDLKVWPYDSTNNSYWYLAAKIIILYKYIGSNLEISEILDFSNTT
jgi:hypothetical protein